MTSAANVVGHVVSLGRFPVKSMQGEELNSVWVTLQGLLGDRGYAMIDQAEGRVVSAKNPRKWPTLFDFRATYCTPPAPDQPLPPVRITLPDGSYVCSDQDDTEALLSRALGHPVRLTGTCLDHPLLEEYWPDLEHLPKRGTVTVEPIPDGTFFDGAPVHLLTTASLDALRGAYPAGHFEARRFRPNLIVRPTEQTDGFLENTWLERLVAIGDEAQLRIVRPCPRCVMTTLPQADLPADPGILRTAARQNEANVGVYVDVVRPGLIRRGDALRFLEG